MSAPTSRRIPSRRELVYRLATATGLTAPQIGATLDGDRVGCRALERCILAAERIGVELPAAPRRPSRVVEHFASLRATAPSPPRRDLRGRGAPARSREAFERRHELNTNRDAAPPRGENGAA